MNKAFVKESSDDDDDELAGALPQIPAGAKNYITPAGYQRIREELLQLIDVERPEVVKVVHWAASNGDRSENGDYIYGKRRLREIDRRIRFLTKRMDLAEVVDPTVHHGGDQVFFGATVRYANAAGEEHTVTIVGIDELDPLVQSASRRRADAAIESLLVVVDAGSGRCRMRLENAQQQLAPATTEIEHVMTG